MLIKSDVKKWETKKWLKIFLLTKLKINWWRWRASGLYVLDLIKYLLIIENNSSKHGYHKRTIIKYGEIKVLLKEKFIR